jgi:hypothetical protein
MNITRRKFISFCRVVFVILLASNPAEAACVNDSLAQIDGQILVAASGAVTESSTPTAPTQRFGCLLKKKIIRNLAPLAVLGCLQDRFVTAC